MACDKKQAATNANRQMDLSSLYPAALTTHARGHFVGYVLTFASQSTCAERDGEKIKGDVYNII